MDPIQTISLALGASWASGLNLYAALLTLGIMGATGAVDLPPALAVVEHPVVILVALVMYCVEFCADKIPGVDTAWDAIHTFIRIPAGAVLAAAALGPVHPAYQVAAALLGGAVATSTHATKAGSRMLINTSPEPASNWIASITEDFAVFFGVWAALRHPLLFLFLFALFLLSLIWLLPIIYGGLKRIYLWLRGTLRPPPSASSSAT